MVPLRFCAACGAANPRDNTACYACRQPLLLHERYQLEECIGKGGFGAVYRAEDLQVPGSSVAVKQINLSGLTPKDVIDATYSFNREAELLSALSHPHLPRIHAQFSDAEHWYLVMDFIAGDTLAVCMEQYFLDAPELAFPLETVLDIGLQLCDVLDYLHTRQPPIVFRDLKPGNVMRTPNGHLYLIDFGIARRFTPGKRRDTVPLGSPGYAAPEQYGRFQTTPRADIYSLGVLFHQLLTCSDPSENLFQVTRTQRYGGAGQRDLQELIMRMVELDERKRPESIRYVKQQLELLARQHLPATSSLRRKPGLASPPIQAPILPSYTASNATGAAWAQQAQVMATQGSIGVKKPSIATAPQIRARRRVAGTLLCLTGLTMIGGGVWNALSPVATAQPSLVSAQSSMPSQKTLPNDGRRLSTYLGHNQPVEGVLWSPDRQYIASYDSSAIVHVWNIANSDTAFTHDFSDYGALAGVAWLFGGLHLAVAVGHPTQSKSSIFICDLKGTITTWRNGAPDLYQAVWSPDSQFIAEAGDQDVVQIYNANTNALYNSTTHAVADRPAGSIEKIVWSPDSKMLASGNNAGWVRVWDAASGKTAWRQSRSLSAISALVWSPDGKSIAYADHFDSQIIKCDVRNGNFVYAFYGAHSTISTLAWSPNSKRIASAGVGAGHIVEVWDVATGSTAFTYHGHIDDVLALSWSPDGKSIASTSADTTVQIWNAQ